MDDRDLREMRDREIRDRNTISGAPWVLGFLLLGAFIIGLMFLTPGGPTQTSKAPAPPASTITVTPPPSGTTGTAPQPSPPTPQ